MKKLITAILLFSTALTLSFAAPKKGKEVEQSNGIKLDPKKKYAIEGIVLGSDNWPKVTLSNKGEIIWNPKHAGIRVELAAGQNFEEPHVWLENPASTGDWGFNFAKDGVCYAFFNGQNKGWGDMKNPDITQGFLIKIGGNVKKFKKTVIKSIELVKKKMFATHQILQFWMYHLELQYGSLTFLVMKLSGQTEMAVEMPVGI